MSGASAEPTGLGGPEGPAPDAGRGAPRAIPSAARPDAAARVVQFEEALFADRMLAERVMSGQQFNAYERTNGALDEDEEPDDEDAEFIVAIGPVTDARYMFEVTGRDRAAMVEAALKLATEVFRERIASADRSPKGQDPAEGLDAQHESAVGDSRDALLTEALDLLTQMLDPLVDTVSWTAKVIDLLDRAGCGR